VAVVSLSLVLGALALGATGVGCAKARAKQDSAALPAGAVPVASGASAGSEVGAASVPSGMAKRAEPAGAGSVLVAGHEAPLSFAPIAKKADPSVVTITTVGEEQEPHGLFSRGRRRETRGLGTGFVITTDGTILTNNHVVEGADQVVVQLSNGHPYPAKVLGRDASTDIAIVKIDSKESLTALPLGDSDAADVGDWVVAIGNPFGLSHTVSVGIVSAKGRTREDVPLDPSGYYDFIQTDASINPGNSGGPLLNLRGEVVGMNTAVRGGGAQGIGFAIPINMVQKLLPTLLRDGKITRSAMGVRIRDARELSPEEKAQIHFTEENGAVIEDVEPQGAAAKAGLKPGDVVVAFDNTPVEGHKLLQWLASTAGVGKTVTVRVMRAGKAFDQTLTLGQLAERPRAQRRHPAPADDEP
jgi:serine protease Do